MLTPPVLQINQGGIDALPLAESRQFKLVKPYLSFAVCTCIFTVYKSYIKKKITLPV